MMFAFTILCLSFFVSMINAGPLTKRVIFNPHITSPNANTVWPVGTKQTVTWETADIPPDSQLTRTDGRVVLGHLGSTGGLNLQSDNLAANFKLRDGKVQITVPNVPLRNDYIIVLFGDSGNSSPGFAITSGGAASSTSSTAVAQNATGSTVISTPIPITGSTITGGSSGTTTPTLTTDNSTPTSTTPVSTGTSNGTTSQSSQTQSTSTQPASTQSSSTSASNSPQTTSSAWGSHRLDSSTLLTISIMSLALMLVI